MAEQQHDLALIGNSGYLHAVWGVRLHDDAPKRYRVACGARGGTVVALGRYGQDPTCPRCMRVLVEADEQRWARGTYVLATL